MISFGNSVVSYRQSFKTPQVSLIMSELEISDLGDSSGLEIMRQLIY